MAAIRIYYDGDCPFCSRYARYLRLQAHAGKPELVDLRRDPAARKHFAAQGYAPDKGMLVEYRGELYAGARAMHLLSLLSTPSTRFNAFVAWLMSRPSSATLLYPLLRMGRAAVLICLGRRALESEKGWRKSPHGFFFFAFGLFGFLHLLIYIFSYGVALYPTSYLAGLFGALLALFPLSRRLFLALIVTLAVDGVLHAPIFSNHTLIKNFFVLGVLVAGLESWIRGESWAWFVQRFAPAGRWLLLGMYFFGVFHKLNKDFLNPEVSCAVTLLEQVPFAGALIHFEWIQLASIYGTLVVETVIALCLLVPASRNLGIFLGIAFHSLLALSGYAMYAPFSTLSIALHCLFLPPFAHAQLAGNRRINAWLGLSRRALGVALLLLWVVLLACLAHVKAFDQFGLLWLLFPVLLLWAVYASGQAPESVQAHPVAVTRTPVWGWILLALFMFNGFAPYLGLKTAQSINMFANLRLEGGTGNHLVLPWAPRPFGYLKDTVEIVEPGGVGYFKFVKQSDLRLTWYDFLNRMERADAATRVSYRRNGVYYEGITQSDLRDSFANTLHARWIRSWLHFTPVNLKDPKPCARNN